MRPLGVAASLAVLALVSFTACGHGGGTRRIPEFKPVVTQPLTPEENAAVARIAGRAADEIALGNTPGAVIVVSLNGGKEARIIEAAAFGARATEPVELPMTMDTMFDLASVSKVVGTATMAMLLIEDGKMTPQTRVADIIPGFEVNGKDDITVHDLLTHRSGLAPYDQWTEAEAIRGADEATGDALIRRIASLGERYPTGKYVSYSCLNYLTMARVNETVAGESQHAFLKRRVWDPLGMPDTGYLLTDDQKARLAPVFKTLPEDRKPNGIHDPLAYYHGSGNHCPGNAGLYSTAADLARYCEMILGEGEAGGVRVMKPETVRMMTRVQAVHPQWAGSEERSTENTRRGFGWLVFTDPPWVNKDAPDGSFIGHTGYTGTFLWLDTSTKSYTVILTNSVYLKDPPNSSPLRRAVVREMIGLLYGPTPAGN